MDSRLDEKAPRPARRPVPLAALIMMGAGLFLVAAAAWLLVTGGSGLAAQGSSGPLPSGPLPSGPLRVGMTLGNFTLEDLAGKPVSLSDYRGRPVLVNAWATWCPPCQAEMPDLDAFYRQHQSAGFIVLAVNAGETRDQAAGFQAQSGVSFPILLDPQEQLMDRLGISDFPTSILVGRDGRVKAVHVGLFTPAQLEQEILPLIQ